MRGSRQALWQEVLIAALRDAAHGVSADVAHSKMARRVMSRRARTWIGSKDFRLVCDLAGFDPDFILDAFNAGKFDDRKWLFTDKRAKGQQERIAA